MPPQAREIKEKMAVMAMDIIGPLPRTERGNEYILSMIDLSTRWAEAIPLRTTTSEEIAHTMVGEWITRYGMPVEILTDQGPNMVGAVMRQCLRDMCIKPKRSSPEHPAGNGAVERFNGTIGRIITRLVLENQKDWDDLLPYALQAYRGNHHRIVGMSPAEALMGHRMRTIVDVVLPEMLTTRLDNVPYNMLTREEQHMKRMETQRQVRTNLEAEQQRLARGEGDHPTFSSGTRVWIYHPTRVRTKWEASWTGPGEVVRQTSPVNVLVREPMGNGVEKTHILHVSRLKVCVERKPRRTDFPEILLWEPVDEADSGLMETEEPHGGVDEPEPELMEGRLFYEVERVVGHATTRVVTGKGGWRRGRVLYHVKFVGYPVSEEDWYEASGLKRCPGLVKDYRAQFGTAMPTCDGDLGGSPKDLWEM